MEKEDNLRNAATVILTRDGNDGKLEVYLMRRHRDQAFMGGAFVFPGGSIEESDADPELSSYITGPCPEEAMANLQEPEIDASLAFGLYMAAIRETFEEAGVLLAYHENGGLLQFEAPDTAAWFAQARQDIYKKTCTLKDMAQRGRIRFAFDHLTPYAHWITPPIENKRFNTRFFLARVPEGQVPLHDAIEMTESRWIAPGAALSAYRQRDILLMPPTLKTLEELSGYSTTTTLFEHAKRRRIYPILPQALRLDETPTLLLPHDPDYTLSRYKQPPRSDEPSRVVFRDKMWHTEMKH